MNTGRLQPIDKNWLVVAGFTIELRVQVVTRDYHFPRSFSKGSFVDIKKGNAAQSKIKG